MTERILVVALGGGIDYGRRPDGSWGYEDETHMKDHLTGTEFEGLADVAKVCLRESTDVTGSDLDRAIEVIRNSGKNRVVVTSGLGDLPRITKYLDEHLRGNGLTLSVTGSRDLSDETGYDPARENLLYAAEKTLLLPPGVRAAGDRLVLQPHEVAITQDEGFYNKND